MRIFIPLGAALALALLLWPRPAPPAAGVGTWRASAAPRVAVASPASVERVVVYVAGRVARPGVYTLEPGRRVVDALAQAGGERPDADPTAVNLAARLSDGDEIIVPERGAAPAPGAHRQTGRTKGKHRRRGRHPRGGRSADGSGAVTPAAPVDLNTADAQTLSGLPGIGPGLADRIVAFRAVNGPFGSPDELLDVSGFNDSHLDQVLPYVTVR
jgi:competence protein ComEA